MAKDMKLMIELAKIADRKGVIAVISPVEGGVRALTAKAAPNGWEVKAEIHEGVDYEALRARAAENGFATARFVDLPEFSVALEGGAVWDASRALFAAHAGNFGDVLDNHFENAAGGYMGDYVSDAALAETGVEAGSVPMGDEYMEWLATLDASSDPAVRTFAAASRDRLSDAELEAEARDAEDEAEAPSAVRP